MCLKYKYFTAGTQKDKNYNITILSIYINILMPNKGVE